MSFGIVLSWKTERTRIRMCDRSSDPSTYDAEGFTAADGQWHRLKGTTLDGKPIWQDPRGALSTEGPWGQPWGAPYITNDGVHVAMRRKGQRVRFYTLDGAVQVGHEHRNVVPAMVWAIAQGWLDTLAPDWLMSGMREEVAANTRRKGAHK